MINSLVGQAVLVFLIKTFLHVLINNSRTAGPAKILMLLLIFSDNFLRDDYNILFLNGVDNFEMALKTCSVLVRGTVPS